MPVTRSKKRKDPDSRNNNEKTRASKKSKPLPEDDLTCAITLELPVDPVFAEDGRVYERYDIEKHFKIKQAKGHAVSSPITNQPMGSQLISAMQHKNLIGTLIANGSITGELADKWKERKKLTPNGLKMMREADEDGDAESMYNVAVFYRYGVEGFEQDDNLHFVWMKKVHEAGSVYGTAGLGKAYLFGEGVERCYRLGMVYTSMAAALGSDMAAFYLGMGLANGDYDLPINIPKAIKWLRKSVDHCEYEHISDSLFEEANTKLQELARQNSGKRADEAIEV